MKKKKPLEWSRLDNAAKIFPANSKKSDTKVFRFVCKLNELVDKDVLQESLDITIGEFPLYNSVIKSGLFWYYLEKSHLVPIVTEENTPPCSSLFDRDRRTLLFRVMYYKNRISFEVYHALTDGTGALQFLRTLVLHYIVIKHPESFKNGIPLLDYDASKTQKTDDSFLRYYTSEKNKDKKKKLSAYQIRGLKLPENRIKVIEGKMSLKKVMSIVKSYNTSLTIFLSALLMCSIHEEMIARHKKYPIVLNIPVNLRKYFISETARNFFGVINVGYNFNENSDDLKEVIKILNKSFKENLTQEKLIERINSFASLERNYFLRAIPLKIKDMVLRIATNIADKKSTSTISNVGRIEIPDELKSYISSFDIFVSTNKLQACICSYEDDLRISFTSAFVSTDIQRRFFRKLTGMEIEIEIIANKIDEE